ncbi:hypothetical protein KSC_009130 [Ktedonobacter sp. SOSP1-52]|uniref:ATP-binding protein n=1 Tax=Ktedonobacter sp. SOSP1-52 TaxID=2778366 RepID=UPI00191677AB|nr:ATP-binding protein [Ktedonobacter sp. SOSP1-52]GHO62021.1 hypothetical protein KSC_009130 [Ktedonobacter sp. SOSP1-52]
MDPRNHIHEGTQETDKFAKPDPDTDEFLSPSRPLPPSVPLTRGQRIGRFLQLHTFAPEFFPPQLQHAAVGYVCAVLLPILATLFLFSILRMAPSFHFIETPIILMVVIISLGWGTVPGILATLVGTLMLAFVLQYSHATPMLTSNTFALTQSENIFGLGLFAIIGLSVSLVTSQTQHARRAATRAHHQVESLLIQTETIFENINDAIMVMDTDGKIIRFNQALQKLLAFDEDYPSLPPAQRGAQVLPRDEYGNPLTLEQWPLRRILQGEELSSSQPADIILQTLDKRTIHVSITGTPIRSQHGRIIGGVLVLRDVTQRREQERRTHEALASMLIMAEALVGIADSTTSEALAGKSNRDVFHRLLKLACDLLGYRSASAVTLDSQTGQLQPIDVYGFPSHYESHWWQHVSGVSLDDYLSPQQIAQLGAGQVINFHLSERRKPEALTYGLQSVLLAPLRIGDRFIGVLSLDYEGSGRKYSPAKERAIASAVGKLTALLVEREHLVRERAEARARELAALETTRMMDDFIGIAAHELRTPMTAIKTSVQLARRQVRRILKQQNLLSEEMVELVASVQSFLTRTERQINTQMRMIRDLLDVSRIRADQLELQPENCNLAQVVRECAEDLRDMDAKRSFTLNLPGKQRIAVVADVDRLRQVVMNYLTNALKYSDASQPITLTVSMERDRVRVAVIDHGPGITKEQQSKIWERFYRDPDVEVRSGSAVGLGIGLHVSRTIIEGLGGQVGLESQPGEGSIFWFTLPLAR